MTVRLPGIGSRAATVAIAVLAVVAACLGVVTVIVRGVDGSPSQDSLKAVTPVSGSDAGAMPAPSASARPSPSRTAPHHRRSPRPAIRAGTPVATPAATATDPSPPTGYDGGLGPAAPGSVYVPYESGQHQWSGTSNGVKLEMSMSPSAPLTGEAVTFTVTASSDHDCCVPYIVYGNGETAGEGPCKSPNARSTTQDFTTYFNAGGLHEFLVGANTGDCSNQQGDLYGWVDIGEGTHSGQGPRLPTVHVDYSAPLPGHDGEPGWVTLAGGAEDLDGFIGTLEVDWGDGHLERFPGDPYGCNRGHDGWPTDSTVDLPPYPHQPAHQYRKYGVFTVRVIAVSTSCEGKDPQRGVAKLVVDNSAPEPSDSPTPSETPTP